MTADNSILTIRGATVGFSALKKPFEGQFGAKYSLTLEFDANNEAKETLDSLMMLARVLTKGGPVDVKDDTGLKSTGILKLSFNSVEPIAVYDGTGALIPQDLIPSLGRGSKVNVQMRVATVKSGGTFKYLNGVQIAKLVEYSAQKPAVKFTPDGDFDITKLVKTKEFKETGSANFDDVFKMKV